MHTYQRNVFNWLQYIAAYGKRAVTCIVNYHKAWSLKILPLIVVTTDT